MARGANAATAVAMYHALRNTHGWNASDAWKGIALLLLSCDIWIGRQWSAFHNCVVYRESNDFKVLANGQPNETIRKAQNLTNLLGAELGAQNTCAAIGQYWRHPTIAGNQPHNLSGNAFRSIVTEILATYGAAGLSYEEEVDMRREFPGFSFSTRSKVPKIDIVVRRGQQTVALISTRWRFRHDRVDVVDEAHAYVPAARRSFPRCNFYAVVGEFNPARLLKIIENTPPTNPNGIIAAAVHFQPSLITQGLGENGRIAALRGLDWLVAETRGW